MSTHNHQKDIDPIQRIEARIAKSREQHRQDVEHVQAHHPELAQVLTEFTEAFGRLEYRVTLKPFV